MKLVEFNPQIQAISTGVIKTDDITTLGDNAVLTLLESFGFRPLALIPRTGYVVGISSGGGLYLVDPLCDPLAADFKLLIGTSVQLTHTSRPGIHVECVELTDHYNRSKDYALRIVAIDNAGRYLVNALVKCVIKTA